MNIVEIYKTIYHLSRFWPIGLVGRALTDLACEYVIAANANYKAMRHCQHDGG